MKNLIFIICLCSLLVSLAFHFWNLGINNLSKKKEEMPAQVFSLKDDCLSDADTVLPSFKFLTDENYLKDKDSWVWLYLEPTKVTEENLLNIISSLNLINSKKERLVIFFFDELKLAEAFQTGKINLTELDKYARAIFLYEEGNEFFKIRDKRGVLNTVFEYELIGKNCFLKSNCSTSVYLAEKYTNQNTMIYMADQLKKKNKQKKKLRVFFFHNKEIAELHAKFKFSRKDLDENIAGAYYYDSSEEHLKIKAIKNDEPFWKVIFPCAESNKNLNQ